MRILVVCKYKEDWQDHAAPFVVEQVNALQAAGMECRLFLVKGKGVKGYFSQLAPLRKAIEDFRPDVIHAHYGLCGWLANLQRKTPVVTTYHGSDINERKPRFFSRQAMRLSRWNIFVSKRTLDKVHPHKCYALLPCGVDLNQLQLTEKKEARRRMQLDESKRYVLFAGAFDNLVKDPELAKETVASMSDAAVELLELKGYSREEVTLLMCSVDALLMTSVNEGSPQVIKEAMACGCPIVSVDVGDVRERIQGIKGCFVATTRKPQELSLLLEKAMAFEVKTKGRETILAQGLDNREIVCKIIEIYNRIIH